MAYIFSGLVVVAILLWLVRKYAVKHPIVKKLLGKFATLAFWVGLLGLIWFGFRFEAVPIFSKRYWSALVLVGGLVWLGFVKWYWLRHFSREKSEYDYNQLKSKYIK